MVIFNGPRGIGKTEALIKLAAEKDCIIICHSFFECSRIKFDSESMGLKIENPITYSDAVKLNANGQRYLIDNIDSFLKYITRNEVIGFSITSNT